MSSDVATQIRVRARTAQIAKEEGLTWREASARAAQEIAQEVEDEKTAPEDAYSELKKFGRALALPVCTAIEMAVAFFIAAKLTHPLLLSVFTESQLANSSFAGVLFLIIAFFVGLMIGALFPAFQSLVIKDQYVLRLAINLIALAFVVHALKGIGTPPLPAGETELHAAVRDNDWRKIETFRDRDLEVRNSLGQTPLMIAVELAASGDEDQLELVRKLLELGADVNARDSQGKTALVAALRSPQLLELLGRYGASLNLGYRSDTGYSEKPCKSIWSELATASPDEIIAIAEKFPDIRTPAGPTGEAGAGPLVQATRRPPSVKLVEYFLRRGANARDVGCGGDTALHGVVQSSDQPTERIKIIDLLLAAGADINARNDDDITPLMWSGRSPEITRHLVEKGADVNAISSTYQGTRSVLDMYEYYKYTEGIAIIRAAGAKPANERSAGQTAAAPGSSARGPAGAESVDDEMRRAELNARSAAPAKSGPTPASQPSPVAVVMEPSTPAAPPRGAETALHAAVGEDDLARVKSLLGSGFDIQAVDPAGRTPLMLAVGRVGDGHYDQLDVVRFLLDKGAAVNVRDAEGKPLLMYAGPDWLLLQALADHGADPTLGWRGRSVWHQLEEEKYQTVAGVAGRFDKIGTPLDREGKHCAGPLHVFAAAGDAKLVAYFLRQGQPAQGIDGNGRTPLHVLVSHGHRDQRAMIEIAELLVRNGVDVNAKDSSGYTALNYTGSMPEVRRRLIELGADAGGIVKR